MAFKCGSYTAIGTAANGVQACLPIRCRQWHCPTCGPREKRRLIRRFVAGSPDALLTLTHKPDEAETYEQSFRRLSLAVNHLFKRIRRHFPRQVIAYALVWETTKKGQPHAHLLLRAPFIHQGWLSVQWHELTGASIVDIRRIQQQRGIANYVAKYLTKAPVVPFGSKRYRTSRNYSPAPPRGQLSALLGLELWTVTPLTQDSIRKAWTERGMLTYFWQDFILVGREGPPPQPGFDPDLDQVTIDTYPPK